MKDYKKPDPELYGLEFISDSFNGMPYMYLGKSGCRVSKVGLGTWKYGYPDTGDGARVDKKTAFKIFDRAIELGVTFWDTANRYNASSGNSERVIGEWFKANPDQRRNVVIATKLFGQMDGKTPNHCGLGRINIMEAAYACMERLQVEHIDVMFFHHSDPVTPIEESLQAIKDLISRDIIRYFSVHNFNVNDLRAYDALVVKGYPQIAAVENIHNILETDIFEAPGVKEYCVKTEKSFIAWGPLLHGIITNSFPDIEKLTSGNQKKLNKLAELARDWGMEVNQLTLSFMLTLPGMGPVIPEAYTVEQLESNAKAGMMELSKDQVETIKKTLLG